jgi:hypothetical protein
VGHGHDQHSIHLAARITKVAGAVDVKNGINPAADPLEITLTG